MPLPYLGTDISSLLGPGGGDLIAVQFRHVSVRGHPNIYMWHLFDSNTTSVTGVPAIESATLGYVLVRERTGG